MRRQATKARLVNPPVRELDELASATECTGLTPSAVRTPEEADSYAELYGMRRLRPVRGGAET